MSDESVIHYEHRSGGYPVEHRSRFARRLCVAVDAASYSSRDSVAQYDLQSQLSQVLDEAAAAARLDRRQWTRQSQGDGELALIPHDQPEPRLIDDFVRELDATLRLRNHGRERASRLRLRVAMDFGVAYEAEFGFAGDAVIATARLLASDCLRQALKRAPDASVAIALSSNVYQTVVDRHTSLTADQFSAANVQEKEYRARAWIRVLGAGSSPPDGGAAGGSDPPAIPTAQPGKAPAAPAGKAPAAAMTNNFYDDVTAGVIGFNFTAARDGQR